MDNKILNNNRKFWKTVNSLCKSITIISKDTDGTITKNKELTETFNSFFWSIIDNLKTVLYRQTNVSAHPDPVLRAIETFKKYIKSWIIYQWQRHIVLYKLYYSTRNLNSVKKKACQENFNPIKKIKPHNVILYYFIYHNFNNSLFSSIFPLLSWKRLILYQFIKRGSNLISTIIASLVSFLFSQKFMKGAYLINIYLLHQILCKCDCGFCYDYRT